MRHGEQATTISGRETAPYPRLDFSTNRKAKNTIRRVNQWLIDEAIKEAEYRRDEYNARIFRHESVKNLPQACIESMQIYLFHHQPPVIDNIIN
jgi:hypothetical protein